MFEIDGSVLEGGGQILRISLCLSAILKLPIKISKIRLGRSKPGLAAQHLKGVELLRDMCGASLHGAHMGSTQIEFHPHVIKGGTFFADPKTAGSISLLLQVALPVALFSNAPTFLELRGGTNCEMAPQIDFMTEIFARWLERFGATFDFNLLKRGYFPKGGGLCKIEIQPVRSLKAIDATTFGTIERINGWSYVAGTLPLKMAHEMAGSAKQMLPKVSIDIEVYKEDFDIANQNCSGIILSCETSTGCTIGGSALGNRRVSCFETGQKAAQEILDATSVQSCVDDHIQDQVIIFMALAKGKSRIRCRKPLTSHTETAIHICKLLTKAKFNVVNEERTCIIECEGIGHEML